MIHTSFVPVLAATIVTSFVVSFTGKLLADYFLNERLAIFGSLAGLQYATNSGVAFSITFPGPLQKILIAVALICIVWVATKARTTMSKIAFGMIIGGALGNVVDRLGDGVVTDFFQIGTFPIFNVADSFITVGVFLLLLEGVLHWLKRLQ